MHSSLTVAQYLLDRAAVGEPERSLTPMQVIKLVYLCHGWMLGLHGRRLINEDVEAWRYGPVIRELYDAVKRFRSEPVVGPIADAQAVAKFDADEKSVMDQVFDIYGQYNGIQLSKLTHAKGTPWSEIRRTSDKSGWEVIPNAMIEEHFRELAQQP